MADPKSDSDVTFTLKRNHRRVDPALAALEDDETGIADLLTDVVPRRLWDR
jgi:hypothetical protein